jgi:hypothetical protein
MKTITCIEDLLHRGFSMTRTESSRPQPGGSAIVVSTHGGRQLVADFVAKVVDGLREQ